MMSLIDLAWIIVSLCVCVHVVTAEKCPEASAACEDVVCPQLLRCDFSKKQKDFCDPHQRCCMRRVCTCTGTENGLSSSGSSQQIIKRFKNRYTNCTVVEGNVELTDIENNVTFTKHIEEVTGYILISRFRGHHIDFSSLRLIRGLELFKDPPKACKGTAEDAAEEANKLSESFLGGSKKYALFVRGNHYRYGNNLNELWMPNLTEITNGDVVIDHNKDLCFVDTIKWEDILEDSTTQRAEIRVSSTASCLACSSSCYDDEGQRHCWGNLPSQCQLLTKTNCNSCSLRNRRCMELRNGLRGCCDSKCAGGCFAPADASACYACDTLNVDGRCVDSCPTGQSWNQNFNTTKQYQLKNDCVSQCPDNFPRNGRFCQTYCPENMFDFEGNVCEDCNDRCNSICPGLGVKGTPFENDTVINSINIKYFNKNCTIIKGSLQFSKVGFQGDRFCRVNPIDLDDFQRFENVREITGYLSIEGWKGVDLCFFKNLHRIRGKQLFQDAYALSIIGSDNSASKLRSLCLHSLQQIDRGVVQILSQRSLCYADQSYWDNIVVNDLERPFYLQVKQPEKCVQPRNCSKLGNEKRVVISGWPFRLNCEGKNLFIDSSSLQCYVSSNDSEPVLSSKEFKLKSSKTFDVFWAHSDGRCWNTKVSVEVLPLSNGSTFDNINHAIQNNINAVYLTKEIGDSIIFNCIPPVNDEGEFSNYLALPPNYSATWWSTLRFRNGSLSSKTASNYTEFAMSYVNTKVISYPSSPHSIEKLNINLFDPAVYSCELQYGGETAFVIHQSLCVERPIAVSLELPDVVCNPRYSFLEGSPGTVACTVFSSKAKAESGQLVVQWIKDDRNRSECIYRHETTNDTDLQSEKYSCSVVGFEEFRSDCFAYVPPRLESIKRYQISQSFQVIFTINDTQAKDAGKYHVEVQHRNRIGKYEFSLEILQN